MKKLVLIAKAMWEALPLVLMVAAVAFVCGLWVQGKHSAAHFGAQINELKAQHLQNMLDVAAERDKERTDYLHRLNAQREDSNAKHTTTVARYDALISEFERLHNDAASKAMYLRATADSTAARAATAEELFGICRREYVKLAKKAELHTLDLRDALVQ